MVLQGFVADALLVPPLRAQLIHEDDVVALPDGRLRGAGRIHAAHDEVLRAVALRGLGAELVALRAGVVEHLHDAVGGHRGQALGVGAPAFVRVDDNARAEWTRGSESRTGAKALRRSALATTFVVDDEKEKSTFRSPFAVPFEGDAPCYRRDLLLPSSGGRTVFRYRSCMAAACTACVSALMMRGRLALHRSRIKAFGERKKKRHLEWSHPLTCLLSRTESPYRTGQTKVLEFRFIDISR